MTIHLKAVEQLALFIMLYKMVLSFESENSILQCDDCFQIQLGTFEMKGLNVVIPKDFIGIL